MLVTMLDKNRNIRELSLNYIALTEKNNTKTNSFIKLNDKMFQLLSRN